MKRPTRLIFFALLPLVVAVAAVAWALSRVAESEREVRRALPATTQVVTEPAGVKWALRRSRPLAGAGLADERTWYVAYLGGMGPPGRTLPVMAVNVIQGSFASATGRGGIMFREPIGGSPLLVERVLYLPMGPADVVAVDLDTRQPAWTTHVGAPVAALAHAGGRLLARTANTAAGLDAVGGRVLWCYTAPGPITTGGGLSKQYACVGTDAALHVLDAASGKSLRDVALPGLRGDVVIDGETASYVAARRRARGRSCSRPSTSRPDGRGGNGRRARPKSRPTRTSTAGRCMDRFSRTARSTCASPIASALWTPRRDGSGGGGTIPRRPAPMTVPLAAPRRRPNSAGDSSARRP